MTDLIFCPSCGTSAPLVTKRDGNGMNEDVCICARCGDWHLVQTVEESSYQGREMNNTDRAVHGELAVKAGTPDFGQNDRQTDLGDALCNMLHYARLMKLHWLEAIRMANIHFDDEVEEELLASCAPDEEHIHDEDGEIARENAAHFPEGVAQMEAEDEQQGGNPHDPESPNHHQ